MDKRKSILQEEMFGFDSLIEATKGLLIGHSIATGEIWHTNTMEETVVMAHLISTEYITMTSDWGYEA